MAGFNNNAMIIAANALRAACIGAQLHTALAGPTGTANLCSSGRVAVSWGAAFGNGDFGLATQLNFTGGGASNPIFSVTLWSTNTTGGTCLGEFILAGDVAFNGAGEYSITQINHDGTAS